jgi:hypothetical protein
MKLSLYSRAFPLVTAVCTASAVVMTVAEMGHPPDDGIGGIASLLLRICAQEPLTALASTVDH